MRTPLEVPTDLGEALRVVGLVPSDLVLYINSACNLRCRHCYVGNQLLNASRFYDANAILAFTKSFSDLDRVTVLGGEPFLHPEINEILSGLLKLKDFGA